MIAEKMDEKEREAWCASVDIAYVYGKSHCSNEQTNVAVSEFCYENQSKCIIYLDSFVLA